MLDLNKGFNENLLRFGAGPHRLIWASTVTDATDFVNCMDRIGQMVIHQLRLASAFISFKPTGF